LHSKTIKTKTLNPWPAYSILVLYENEELADIVINKENNNSEIYKKHLQKVNTV